MIRTEELEKALEHIKVLQDPNNGMPWHLLMENEGFDPNSVLSCAADHGGMLVDMGMASPQDSHINAISFGAGFTLAIVALMMERDKHV